MFFGNFTALRPEVVLWRLRSLAEIIEGRRASLGARQKIGILAAQQANFADVMLRHFRIWVVVARDEDKLAIQKSLAEKSVGFETEVISLSEVQARVAEVGGPAT